VHKRPFIPANFPKSFVIGICALLSGLVAGGLMMVGHWTGVSAVLEVARILFFACWAVAAIMFLIYIPNTWTGKYRNLPSRPWREQVW
jgi:hypothetical protein